MAVSLGRIARALNLLVGIVIVACGIWLLATSNNVHGPGYGLMEINFGLLLFAASLGWPQVLADAFVKWFGFLTVFLGSGVYLIVVAVYTGLHESGSPFTKGVAVLCGIAGFFNFILHFFSGAAYSTNSQISEPLAK